MKVVRVGNVYVFEVHNPASDKMAVRARASVNHIWIYDRSQSMYHTLPDLVEDLINHSKTLPIGDTLSLGWFSTQGNFRFVLVGHVIGRESYDVIEKIVRANNTVIGLTCFSDILSDSKTVSENLRAFGDNFSLVFFTDGYPVVDNYRMEIERIFSALGDLKERVQSALFVGYGGYYNRELMGQMTRILGGTLIHASRLADFSENMAKFSGSVKQNFVHVPIPEMKETYGTFYLDHGNVVTCQIAKDGALIPETASNVYFVGELDKSKPLTGQTIEYASNMEDGVYAAALVLNQSMRTDLAINMMTELGDTAIVDALSGAWTNDEHGKAERLIVEALNGDKYTKGKREGYVTKDNAFCLLDLIGYLLDDPEAMFYPYHTGWTYRRIGVKHKTKEGYPAFLQVTNPACSFRDFVWNQTRLNLSARARIEGTIRLDERAGGLGFSETFPTFVWRNYTIVRDGVLNIPSMWCSMSKDTFDLFWALGVIDRFIWRVNEPVEVFFDRVPMVNKAIASPDKLNAGELCAQIWREVNQQAYMKVIKYLRDQIQPEKPVSTFFTAEQNEYLASFGVTANGFNPPTEAEESVDYYMAKEFEIKLAGFSSLPKVTDVLEKASKSSSNSAMGNPFLTPANQLMYGAYLEVTGKLDGNDNQLDLLTLQGEYLKHNAILHDIRQDKQKTLFSVLLTKQWFKDLTTRDGAVVIDSEGHKFTFSIRDVKEYY